MVKMWDDILNKSYFLFLKKKILIENTRKICYAPLYIVNNPFDFTIGIWKDNTSSMLVKL